MPKSYTNLKKLCLLSLLCLSSFAIAQSVSFSNQTSILPTFFGDAYEDCALDMNGDYLDDIVNVTDNSLVINYQQNDGSFTQSTYPVSFNNLPGWSLCGGDLDGNGFNDLLFGSGSNVSFILANDDGTAYTEQLNPEYVFSQRSTLHDIDNDGDLDAFVCHDVDQSVPFRNDGNGVMTIDFDLIQTADRPGNYAALWVDYDNDSDSDLYITKCELGSTSGDINRTNLLYRNNGDGTFTEVAAEANMDDNSQSWATVFEDFDNDGDFDAFIVNHDFENLFKLNNGDGTFSDIIDATGIDKFDLGAWENAAADFNNDGYVDILSELQNSLYINNGDLTFTAQDLPFDDGGIGDFNNDGFLDVINGGTLWMNEANDNNWVKINTEGIIGNKNGIGARVEIYGEWGIQIREVRSGQSFSPMSSTCIHFGLGAATTIDQIVVKWPSGVISTLESPAINSTYTIPEAGCLLSSSSLEVTGLTQLCPGETVQIEAPSGFDTYLWSNGETTSSIEVASGGSYNAILTDDSGCISLSETVKVEEVIETAPQVQISGSLMICDGESVSLSTDDGTNPLWSNGTSNFENIITETGDYFVAVQSLCTEEQFISETIHVEVIPAPMPEVENAVINESGNTIVTANGENIEWFSNPEATNSLGTGNELDLGEVEASTSLYATATNLIPGEIQFGGKDSYSGPGGLPSTGAYSFFDAYEPFTLLAATVFVPDEASEGVRDFILYNSAGEMLGFTSADLGYGEHLIYFDFDVPEGTGYYLTCEQNNLFRNDGDVSYPYPIGDVGAITGSFYGGDYYYYFYNWQVQKESYSCVSDVVPVSVAFAGIEDNNNPDFSVFPNPNQGSFTFSFPVNQSSKATLEILDVLGKVVYQESLTDLQQGINQQAIQLKNIATGIYTLSLNSSEHQFSKQILVN